MYLLSGDRFEAEELAQGAFVKAWERWDRIGSMENPSGYLYPAAVNARRSALRSRRWRSSDLGSAGVPVDPASPGGPMTTFAVFLVVAAMPNKILKVPDYTREDGTKVMPHDRSTPTHRRESGP